ncbi:MAG TPA: sulfotransferase, partial [Bryobacteraceae bacterium]|nr:sulfotransferase [Bryobacteraceae bacterium]
SLERLIGTLDGTRMGGEVPIVEKAVRRAFDGAALPPSNHLEDLPAKLLPDFRGKYLEGLAQRAGPARLFTTTLPGRIYDAGLIAMAVPNVRFVLLKRNVDDMAWKIYLTKYLTGNSYAYSLKDIRGYLDWYHAMIDLTAEKLPELARVMSYEALIDDPGAALRGVAELCGLDPHERPVLSIDHDRGCGAPYREFMARDS